MGTSNPNCPFDNWPFWLFIKHDGSFRHIYDICYGLQKWGHNFEDDRIIKAFLSTKAFRDSFDVNTASEESLKYLVNLFGSKKNKKLKVQSHIKFNDIIDATKVDIPPNIMSLFILIFVSILNVGAIKYDVFFNPEVLKLITFIDVMSLSAITVVIKDLVEILRNKYNINVDQERVDEFISLIQDSYKEDVKSL